MSSSLNDYLGAYSGAFRYSFDNEIMLNWYPQRIMAGCVADSSLLELGIGHGYTTCRFSEHFRRHVVIEGAESVIDQFQQQYPESQAEIAHGFFEEFDTDERFDVIVMGFVLEHVDDPLGLLKRYKRFLAPGGRCFVAVPNGESLHRRFGHSAGLLRDMMALGDGDLALGHKRLYSVQSLEDVLTRAGHQVVHREGIFLKPLTTLQMQSLELSETVLEAMCMVGVHYPELSCALLFETKVDCA